MFFSHPLIPPIGSVTDNLITANHAKAWDAKLLAYVLPRQNTVAGLPGVYVLSYSFGKELYSFLEDYTMVKYILTATLLAILSLTPLSFAQTADGITPAEEPVCDDLNGALYGLCVAYCEAMDCDDGDHLASDEACERVLTNYTAITEGDMPPCHDYELNHNNEENDSDDTDDLG
jgi:hypothetical protein